jgi:hypothetical protein
MGLMNFGVYTKAHYNNIAAENIKSQGCMRHGVDALLHASPSIGF